MPGQYDITVFRRDEEFITRHWKDAEIDGWKTKVFDKGENEPILFVPICQNLEVFESKLIQHFSETNRVVFFQRRETTKGYLYIKDRAEDIKRVLDCLGIEKVHIVAHSSGAIAALFFVLDNPEYVKSFVLMCLSPTIAIPRYAYFLATYFARYIPLPKKILLNMLTSRLAEKDTLEYELIYDQWNKFKDIQKIWNHSIWTMSKYDSRAFLPQIKVPVLLINSDNDYVNTIEAMEFFEENLPNCYGLNIVHGGRHFFQYINAEQVIGYMRGFYKQLKSGTVNARLH